MTASAFMGGMLWRLLGLTALLLLVSSDRPALGNGGRPARISPAEQDFIRDHWRRPIPPQGAAPARFSPLERSLSPVSCGTCHPDQLRDWQSSFHAKSMGPGISGQLAEMIKSEPAAARSCFTCHAPLAEQAPLIRGSEGLVPNPDLDPPLQSQGVVCASCHVRGHQRFGPPRRDGTVASRAPRESLPHDGLTRTTAFLRSEFCASCHQFAPNGLALNGKLLENTFEEWRASPAARRGQQCQDCHMPDRRHLWRGIHDPEMVKSGVQIKLVTGRARYRPGEKLTARLTITNTGVGHDFPTYVTPRVLVQAQLLDAAGEPVPGSLEERAIGREVPLDLSREIADTRIPAGGRFTLDYARQLDRPGLRLRVSVTVFPDHFYTGFFESLLDSGAGDGEAQIREALDATRRSAFVIFDRDVPLM
jgi:Cytochrome c554 and c-prime